LFNGDAKSLSLTSNSHYPTKAKCRLLPCPVPWAERLSMLPRPSEADSLIFTAYFDEANHGPAPTIIPGALLGQTDQWRKFNDALNDILTRCGFQSIACQTLPARSDTTPRQVDRCPISSGCFWSMSVALLKALCTELRFPSPS
jgi:hypothetical protein